MLLLDGSVLVTGGASQVVDAFIPLASAELYDPSDGAWTATADMNEGRNDHTATLLLDGRVLVAGGSSDAGGCCLGALASAELYHPGGGS